MQTAIDKIRELRALHEDGLLSRQEFELRKNAILDAAYTPAERAAESRPGTEIGPEIDAPVVRPGTEIGLMAGQEIGPQTRRYRLERLIAHGGMGQVWQATDLATHAELGHSAQVALKILPPHLTQAASHAKLLIQEATRARRLAHEHIVRVYEWAQDPATTSFFLIMEYLEGEDLDAVLARESRLPLGRVLELLDPIADALDYAWEKHRLVHRDIKPGNVFVTARGEVKLLDFGIAARARASGAMSPLDAPATSGTAGYRAPEVTVEGRTPEPTLDVFAVSVMIHQLLTGVLPGAPGGQVPETLGARQWEVLRSGFAADPAKRPATVHALLDAIRAAAGPSAEELARQEVARRVVQDKEAREQAARLKKEQEAAAVVQAQLDEQRRIQLREQQRREKLAAEEARLARKETLRQQLLAKRDEEVAKTQAAKEEAAKKAAHAKAAAIYLAQQKKARDEEEAARAVEQVVATEPAPAGPAAAAPEPIAGADSSGVLRDPFLDGSDQGPAMVLIQTGRFQMGSPEHERRIAMAAGSQKNWIARETPQHWVGIERPFAMGRYPVTVGEWRAFVKATGWQVHGEVDWEKPGFPQTDEHPVVGVTWFDALQYVAWLGEATGKRYRLPSEAEWEYACRAGTKTAFNVGDTIATTQANFDGSFTYNGGPRGDFRHGTTPAGFFPPNAWGLHDMHGNVWEWMQDVAHDNYEGAPIDGSAWEVGGDQVRRILRGGSWLYNPRYLRSALRNGFSAVLSNDIVGFRVVRELM